MGSTGPVVLGAIWTFVAKPKDREDVAVKPNLLGTIVFVVAWTALAAIASGVLAQQQPAADPGADPAAVDGAADVAGDAATDQAEKPLREQTIYIPYTKLRESFEKQGRGVFVPYEEFQKLWQAARDTQPQPVDDKPPVAALITEVASTATVEKDVLQVAATVTIEILQEGWHEVPLRLTDAAISSATIADQPARIVVDPPNGYKLLIKKEGKQPEQIQLALKYSKAYTKAPGQNSVTLVPPQAPVNRWQIRIPQAGVKVQVHPLIAAAEVPAAGDAADETVVQAFVGAAPTVRIEWTAKSEGAAGLAALASVQARQQSTIDEGVIRTRATLVYDITRADLSQLRIEVPADQKVAGVFDPNVQKWNVEPQDELQRITVDLFEPTRGRQNIVVELEKFSNDLTAEDVVVPVIKALDVARQQGVVVARLAEGLRAETSSRAGLLQMDAAELPAELQQGNWTFAYRYATLPFELKLAVEKVQPRIRAEQLVEVYLEPENLTVDLFVVYDIERAGVFQLDLDVPAGFELRQVRGRDCAGGQPAAVDQFHLLGDNQTQLRVNLSRKAFGKVGLWVELERRLDDANLLSPTGEDSEIAVPVPRVAAAGVEQLTGWLVVNKPESLRTRPDKQDGLRSISFAEAFQTVPTTRDGRFPQAQPALAFAYTGDAVDLTLQAQRRKPHVTARQVLIVRVEEGQVKYEAKFNFTIRYSGVKSLRIDVPAALADEIRNDTPGIREATIDPAPDDVADGEVAWSFTGESELLGDVAIRLAWEQKIDELQIGKSVKLDVPHLRPQEVASATGQIIVTKSESIDVGPSGTPEGLRGIDPQVDVLPDDRVAGAARAFEFHEDWKLALEATRYKLEEVKRTSIELAVVRQVVTRSDQIAVQALYRMRSARQRLAIKLPKSGGQPAELDRDPLRINGAPVPLESGDGDALFVPLAALDANHSFLLELRYTLPGTAAELELPEFPDEPAVQKVHLCAYLPDDLALLGARGPWTNEQPSWLQRIRNWFDTQLGRRRGENLQAVGRWQYGSRGNVQSDDDLIRQLGREPAGNFQTDGRLYVFSTLRPEAGEAGALSLLTMNAYWFQTVVFLALAAIGGALLMRPVGEKFAALALLVIAVILAGVFLPIFSEQVMEGVLPWALLVVLIVWAVWFVAHDLPLRRAAAPPPQPPTPQPPSPDAPPQQPMAPVATTDGDEDDEDEIELSLPADEPSQEEGRQDNA